MNLARKRGASEQDIHRHRNPICFKSIPHLNPTQFHQLKLSYHNDQVHSLTQPNDAGTAVLSLYHDVCTSESICHNFTCSVSVGLLLRDYFICVCVETNVKRVCFHVQARQKHSDVLRSFFEKSETSLPILLLLLSSVPAQMFGCLQLWKKMLKRMFEFLCTFMGVLMRFLGGKKQHAEYAFGNILAGISAA